MSSIFFRWYMSGVIHERASKQALEKRLKNFVFTNCPPPERYTPMKAEGKVDVGMRSYRSVVCGQGTINPDLMESATTDELKVIMEHCLKEHDTVEELRQPTSLEIKALDLVLIQGIELPRPPTFIRQVMDSEAQSLFAHIFQNLKYPLYAHLDPGQFMHSDMASKVIFGLIKVDSAASTEEHREVAAFVDAASRVVMNQDTRILTFWFASKTRAQSWAGWKVPMKTRTLQLQDDRRLETMHPTVRPITRFTTYRFQLICKSGELSPLSLHHMLSKELNLQVVQLSHPQLGLRCEDTGAWNVTIQGATFPVLLRKYSVIKYGGVKMIIHLNDLHTNRPCAVCKDPSHPGQRCRRSHEDAKTEAAKRTRVIATASDPVSPPRVAKSPEVSSYAKFKSLLTLMKAGEVAKEKGSGSTLRDKASRVNVELISGKGPQHTDSESSLAQGSKHTIQQGGDKDVNMEDDGVQSHQDPEQPIAHPVEEPTSSTSKGENGWGDTVSGCGRIEMDLMKKSDKVIPASSARETTNRRKAIQSPERVPTEMKHPEGLIVKPRSPKRLCQQVWITKTRFRWSRQRPGFLARGGGPL